MSKLYYRLNSLCTFLKQEKLIDDYDISHLKLEINEKNYHMIMIHYVLNLKMIINYLKFLKNTSYF